MKRKVKVNINDIYISNKDMMFKAQHYNTQGLLNKLISYSSNSTLVYDPSRVGTIIYGSTTSTTNGSQANGS